MNDLQKAAEHVRRPVDPQPLVLTPVIYDALKAELGHEPKGFIRQRPIPLSPKFDRTAYQREYMRKRRAKKRTQ
jgi:hypothetical protein